MSETRRFYIMSETIVIKYLLAEGDIGQNILANFYFLCNIVYYYLNILNIVFS